MPSNKTEFKWFSLKKVLVPVLVCAFSGSFAQMFSRVETLSKMGSHFEVVAVSPDSNITTKAVEAAWQEIDRIERLISEWDTNSQTHLINKNAGIKPVMVADELFQLIKRSIKISDLTMGAFDITFASLDKVWNFKDSTMKFPSQKAIDASVARIGYKKIVLNEDKKSVYLPEVGMKIGFGAIGKGYAANRCKIIMVNLGASGGLVNAGGDLIAWGTKANGLPWKIGIADPKKKNAVFSYLTISNGSVVTSGNYERFVMIDGKRYAHILDPRTGYPVTGLKSVTILCPDAEIADALATGVFVMGAEKGLHLVNQLKEVECILVTDADQIISSDHIQLNE